MHLKRIELYGFKSFANKMVFKFDQGITAIVGPNGSGKSNVADAVRWVLGEQSAKRLRGGTMQDVIFAGTEARKPLGYCQVDLTIDNHDMKMPIEYTEVTVSRRVYRSGEGEYFINGTGCRLRDVHELFMDTGVGQEGYSIIGQGQIDKILSNKPEERRALFDEAVGIVKYKKRKQNAEKRLDQEKQNLYRVNDIISELEVQKETLTEQAEKAKVYLNVKEELKVNEVNVFILDVKNIDEKIKELKEKERAVERNIGAVRLEYAQNKTKHSEYNEKLEALEVKIEDIRGKQTELTVQKEKKESEINLTKEQINHLTSNNERFLSDVNVLSERKNKAEADLVSYKESMASLFDESARSEDELKEKEEVLKNINASIVEEEQTVSNIQANMIERLNEISSIKTQMQRFHTMAENTTSRKDSISSRKRILEASVGSLKANHKEEKIVNEKLLLEKQALVEQKEAIIEGQKTEISELVKAEQERKEQIQRLQTLESKHKALSEISEQYEGYHFSIKKVMSMKDEPQFKNKISGVVADILKVGKQYERAIEIALGGNYQNVIIEDEQSAKALIKYLKDNRFGRATFLPLTNIKPKLNKIKDIASEKGVVGYADELVETDDKYIDIVKYLLGRIVIAETIDAAIALGKKYNNSLRIVTLSGDVVNPGGSLTGGAFKNNNTQFLSRKREIGEMEDRIAGLKDNLRHINSKYQELLYQKEHQQEQLDEIGIRLQELNIDINSQSMKLHQLLSDIKKGEMELDDLNDEESHLLSQEGDLTTQLNDLDATLKENEVNKEHAETTVKNLMARTIELKEEKDQLMDAITKLRVAYTAHEEQRNHAKSNIERMEGELLTISEQIEKLNQDIAENNAIKVDKEARILEHQETIQQYVDIVSEVTEKVSELTALRQGINKKQEALYEIQEEVSEKITLLEKELLRLQNQHQKNELQKENYIEYMWNEYELTYNNALQYSRDDIGTIGVIKKRIDRLKGEIKELGDVNVNAIEDYKNVVERYEFLTTQRNDIIEAEAKLREVIDELEEQMQIQFKEQFAAINTQFQKVFKELFGGGKAFLRLSDEEQVLEAGIHINVQPPGKKLQSMMLLSGGERAFTAIALLFAIQSLKPSPFCVLDEIEAALDDANVDRFAQYLKKLTDNTQFIIITHRRGTMEASDALYGITMQEKGISTQVSVKLIEDVLEV